MLALLRSRLDRPDVDASLPPPSRRRRRCCPRVRRWPALLDGVDEPLLLCDDLGRLSFCNRAAMRALGAEAGRRRRAAGGGAGRGRCRLAGRAACASRRSAPRSLPLGACRRARAEGLAAPAIALAVHCGCCGCRRRPGAPAALGGERGRRSEMLRVLWGSPFPATLQDARLPPRRRQPGLPRLQRLPPRAAGRHRSAGAAAREDRAAVAARRELPARRGRRHAAPPFERRLIDAGGRERWFRASAQRTGATQDGAPLLAGGAAGHAPPSTRRASSADRSLRRARRSGST